MNEDGDEDEEPEMGRRSRSTRSENLSRERRSSKEESRAGEHGFDEEESRADPTKSHTRKVPLLVNMGRRRTGVSLFLWVETRAETRRRRRRRRRITS